MDNKENLHRRIAWLESRLDQVETELANLNELLIDCGFPEGIKTLKSTIEDLMDEANRFYQSPPDEYPPTQTYSN